MPKTNHNSDRAHVILSYDLNQTTFNDFVDEIKKSKFFPNLIGIEVKRPNYGNPVIGLGALLLQDTIEPQGCDEPEGNDVSLDQTSNEEEVVENDN